MPVRRLITDPAVIMKRAGLRPGMRVLELGLGPGFFTPEAARRVGPEGKLGGYKTRLYQPILNAQ